MSRIQVHDKAFEIFIPNEEIQEEIKKMADDINRDYDGKRPMFIAILNGSFMFAADLFRYLKVEAEICFIKLASYKGVSSSGQVITAIGLDIDIIGRDIIILEDIVDTGKTLSEFLPKLMHHQPASLKIAVLLHKPEASQYSIPIDYLAFTIPNKFVVGYGLDYDGLGRNYKDLYQLA
jgi:hypoxanthine phosphoribosyltransferase